MSHFLTHSIENADHGHPLRLAILFLGTLLAAVAAGVVGAEIWTYAAPLMSVSDGVAGGMSF